MHLSRYSVGKVLGAKVIMNKGKSRFETTCYVLYVFNFQQYCSLVICPQVCALTQYAPGVPQRLSDVSRFTEFEYPIILPKLSKYYTHAYILAEVDYHNYGNHLLPVYS